MNPNPPLMLHPSEWAWLTAQGYDMVGCRLIEPIPRTRESVSLNKTLTPMLPSGTAASERR